MSSFWLDSKHREFQAPLPLAAWGSEPPQATFQMLCTLYWLDTPCLTSCWRELYQKSGCKRTLLLYQKSGCILMATLFQNELPSKGRTESTQQLQTQVWCTWGKLQLRCQVGLKIPIRSHRVQSANCSNHLLYNLAVLHMSADCTPARTPSRAGLAAENASGRRIL